LKTNDDRKTEIARFCHKSYGILDKKAHAAYLEIKPEGMSVIDDILITFIWVDKYVEDSGTSTYA